jgi:hypothetical protein
MPRIPVLPRIDPHPAVIQAPSHRVLLHRGDAAILALTGYVIHLHTPLVQITDSAFREFCILVSSNFSPPKPSELRTFILQISRLIRDSISPEQKGEKRVS